MASRPQPKLGAQYTKERFRSHVAVVTGGASGIGKACVKRFLNDGASVAFFDINQDGGHTLEAELQTAGLLAEYYPVDVTDKDACVKAVDDVAKKHGGNINYLVNNAASFLMKGLDSSKADWEEILGVNVVGYSNMVQACYPHMKEAGKGIRAIVNIASITGHRPKPNRWTYDSSKGAVLQMTKCMALDLSSHGIRVNSVSPGLINTAPVENIAADNIRQRSQLLNRTGECSEVAAAIAFLCSRDAAFITGTDLLVDGGYMAMGPQGHGKHDTDFTGSIPE